MRKPPIRALPIPVIFLVSLQRTPHLPFLCHFARQSPATKSLADAAQPMSFASAFSLFLSWCRLTPNSCPNHGLTFQAATSFYVIRSASKLAYFSAKAVSLPGCSLEMCGDVSRGSENLISSTASFLFLFRISVLQSIFKLTAEFRHWHCSSILRIVYFTCHYQHKSSSCLK